jgi:hypothetical protein
VSAEHQLSYATETSWAGKTTEGAFTPPRVSSPNIYLRLDVTNVSEIDPDAQSFSCEFLLKMSFKAAPGEAMAERLFPGLFGGKIYPGLQMLHSQERKFNTDVSLPYWLRFPDAGALKVNAGQAFLDGNYIRIEWSLNADFQATLDLKDFPYDRQTLPITLSIAPEIHYSIDNISEGAPYLMTASYEPVQTKLAGGWEFEATTRDIVESGYRRKSSLDHSPGPSVTALERKFLTELHVRREPLWPTLKMTLPYLIIGAGLMAIALAKISALAQLMEVTLGLFLGVISLMVTLASMLPKVNIYNRADAIYLYTFFAGILSFALVGAYYTKLFPLGQTGNRAAAQASSAITLVLRILIVALFLVSVFTVAKGIIQISF